MKRRSLLPTSLVLLAVACAGCADFDPSTWSIQSTGCAATSGRFGISGGGVDFAPGEPTLFFGTFTEDGRRAFTYVVIARNFGLDRERSDTTGQTSSDADGATLNMHHEHVVGGRRFEVTYFARVEDDELVDVSLEFGDRVTEEGDWLFLFDGDDASKGVVPMRVDRPEAPADLAELPGFTRELVSELVRSNESIAAFVAR